MAVKEFHGGILWTEWEKDIAFRKEGAIEKWNEKLEYRVEFQKFMQYTFHKQWDKLKKYANKKGIKIIGDIPIFIAGTPIVVRFQPGNPGAKSGAGPARRRPCPCAAPADGHPAIAAWPEPVR